MQDSLEVLPEIDANLTAALPSASEIAGFVMSQRALVHLRSPHSGLVVVP